MTTTPAVSIRFQLTADEYGRALQAMATRSVQSNVFYALLLGLPILVGAGVDFATEGRATLGLPVHLPMWWFGGIVAILLVFAALFLSRSTNRGAFNTSALGRGELTYVLDDVGVAVEGTGARSSISWDSLHRVRETKEFYLLYVSSAVALILPKRAVSAEAEGLLRRRPPSRAESSGHAG